MEFGWNFRFGNEIVGIFGKLFFCMRITEPSQKKFPSFIEPKYKPTVFFSFR